MPEGPPDELSGLLSELGGYGPVVGGGNGGSVRAEPYPTAQGGLNSRGFPLNPGAQECAFYMKTGNCKFGATCRFDHPEAGGAGSGVFNSAGYPVNEGAQDCAFFMKTGQCKFGPTCRFNHPEGVATVAAADAQAAPGSLPGQGGKGGGKGGKGGSFSWGEEAAAGNLNSAGFPLNPGQPDCGFFMKTGNCKFGGTCKFNHPEGVATVVAGENSAMSAPAGGAATLNSMGYPLNPGAQDCGFYMKTGQCKFGGTCRFNHPEMGMAGATADDQAAAAAADLTDNQLALELMGGAAPGRSSTGLPLNPGAADCAFYMKTGTCKFGGTCRFNHPDGVPQQIAATGVGAGGKTLNSAGYPLNPGQADCGFFCKTGICKYGASCKWNHPEGLATAMAGDSKAQEAVMKATKAAAGTAATQVNSAGYPLNPEQADCGFYMKTGQCKFGATCRYNHPEERATVPAAEAMAAAGAAGGGFEAAFAALADSSGAFGASESGAGEAAGLNSQGYPLNPGAQDCAFYMKTGSCKFGGTCRFNHPEPGDAGAVSSAAAANGKAVNSAGYPLNPAQSDCAFYMKTGTCKFGPTCRFNHPEGVTGGGGAAATGMQALGNGAAAGKGGGKGGQGAFLSWDSLNSAGYPLHPDQPDCSFYIKTGTCKFGATCRFNHPETGGAAQAGGDNSDEFQAAMQSLLADDAPMGQQQGSAGALNASGFPMRAGVKACSFYMKTGNCKFGATCTWNHPANVYPNLDLRTLNSCGYPLNQGAEQCSDFVQSGICNDGVQCPKSHPELSAEGDADAAAAMAALGGGEAAHPSRPGQPACAFYMKTGTCKFGPTCKFDHPANGNGSAGAAGPGAGAQLNSLGYPLRPGGVPCAFYMKTGQCKFGATCKNDHPEPDGQWGAGDPADVDMTALLEAGGQANFT